MRSPLGGNTYLLQHFPRTLDDNHTHRYFHHALKAIFKALTVPTNASEQIHKAFPLDTDFVLQTENGIITSFKCGANRAQVLALVG